jgi:hypothetical protein
MLTLRLIEGFCTRETLDWHGEVVRLASLSRCDARLWRGHRAAAVQVGELVRSERRDSGLWIIARVTDHPTWRAIARRELLGFSIEANGPVGAAVLTRVCLVPDPACPTAEISRAWTVDHSTKGVSR